MKLIIGITLLYIILVIFSSLIMKYINREEKMKNLIGTSSIMYLFAALFIFLIYMIKTYLF